MGRATPSFEAFYQAHHVSVLSSVRSIVGDDAEDIAQDAFAALFARWSTVSTYDLPAAWVRRVAIRAAVRERGRIERRRELELQSAAMAGPGSAEEITGARLLTGLIPRDAGVLELRYAHGTPVAEIARELGTTEGAARVRLHRARRRAAESLAGLHGTWTSAPRSRTALARHLRERGYGRAVDAVLDDFRDLGTLRTELHLQDGRFLLTNRGEHLDHGGYEFEKSHLTFSSEGYEGRVTHRISLDADEMIVRQACNENPDVHGVPDAAFQCALLEGLRFSWRGGRSIPA